MYTGAPAPATVVGLYRTYRCTCVCPCVGTTVRTGAPAPAGVVGARHGAVMDLLPVLAEPRVALVVTHRQRREIAVKLCRQTGHKYTSLGTNT